MGKSTTARGSHFCHALRKCDNVTHTNMKIHKGKIFQYQTTLKHGQ